VASEILATIVALFILGSIRYRLDKNALTYGAGLVILATFWEPWWRGSALKTGNGDSLMDFIHRHFFTLHGLDSLIHADTLLFILGLTFFVSCIAQTRLLETMSFWVLQQTGGRVAITVVVLTALVSLASGILDGVSMIGLLIRTLIIILFLARAKNEVIHAILISTLITTVCGMWLAYGEPPNLIMKTNLHPHLDTRFFLRYCLPAAVASWVVIAWNMGRRLRGKKVDLRKLDLLDRHTADIRFLQSSRHGEMLTSLEFLELHKERVEPHYEKILQDIQRGVPLGEALVKNNVHQPTRIKLLGAYTAENLANTLDDYYVHVYGKNDHKADDAAVRLAKVLEEVSLKRQRAQLLGALAFLPFLGLLVLHAFHPDVRLFWASAAGFFVAFFAIRPYPKMRALALKEAAHEFKDYLFLLPLFFSMTLLQKTGFFSSLSELLRDGIQRVGTGPVAYGQFWFCTILSAFLDNNVAADFAARALHGLDTAFIHLFAMAQMAGYALGGCWTPVGSAQSILAYNFLQKEINPHYTPFQWIKAITPLILQVSFVMTLWIFLATLF
jgi:Na+/H+ antiporter NhaD/arsenite permease-like protein